MATLFVMMACFGLLFALIDMGMNGAAYADFAPFWFLVAGVGVVGMWWMGAA